ncbi:MAG: 30S ribosomal protein S12 methylthiotransferase RimO [Firmicutes bacterium]|nr:30S ribosomal protein S12 methylthiotransferase RimO [Bacillota bacterium]
MSLKAYIISLGCAKNRVDTEEMLGSLEEKGYSFIDNPRQATVILINTCAFIKEARRESLKIIKEMALLKREGKKRQLLVVTGCLPQLFKEKLPQMIPDIDVLLGVNDFHCIAKAIELSLSGKKIFKISGKIKEQQEVKKRVYTSRGYAYLKIAEGCNNKCSYCLIPKIRGPLTSKSENDVLQEAKTLARNGFKEIILIAQDTAAYGIDKFGYPVLARLLEKIQKIKDIRWIRLLYLQPHNITDDLIDTIAKYDKVCKYIDMPLQHIDNLILEKMKRKINEKSIYCLIRKLRQRIPGVILRTTLMVGFPGETRSSFVKLASFVLRGKFDRLGCFCYSSEKGTLASEYKRKVPKRVQERRKKVIMIIQRRISKKKNKELIGQKKEAIVEKRIDSNLYWGRTYANAPEVDGGIYIVSDKPLKSGDFIQSVIVGADPYNLIGEITE